MTTSTSDSSPNPNPNPNPDPDPDPDPDPNPNSNPNQVGPAFLVYYSPAFLRNLSPLDALPALRILAEVHRRH